MRTVELTTEIHTQPKTVIAAFTEPDMLRDWWGVEESLIQKKAGGPYTLAWHITEKGFGFVSPGIINEYRPESLLVLDNFVYLNPEKGLFGPMTLTVQATAKGAGTELYLCQDGYGTGSNWDWYYEAVKKAWPAAIQTLKDYLENWRRDEQDKSGIPGER